MGMEGLYLSGSHSPLPRVGSVWLPRIYIRRTQSALEIRKEPLQLVIDQRETFREMGLYTPWMRMDEQTALARQNAEEYAIRISQEGDRLMQIQSGEKAIGNIAAENWPAPPPETNIALIPQTRPRVEFLGGNVDITFKPTEVHITWAVKTPDKK